MTLSHLELRQKAITSGVQELCDQVETIARAIKKVKNQKKCSRVGVNFNVEELVKVIQLPRKHLFSYVGMLRSVTAHRRKVSFYSFSVKIFVTFLQARRLRAPLLLSTD